MIPSVELSSGDDPLKNMYDDLGPKFEEKLLTVATRFISSQEVDADDVSIHLGDISLDSDEELSVPYISSQSYNVLVGISGAELNEWRAAYSEDPHFSQVLKGWKKET